MEKLTKIRNFIINYLLISSKYLILVLHIFQILILFL